MTMRKRGMTPFRWLPWMAMFFLWLVSPAQGAREPQTPEQMYAYAVRQLERGYHEKAVMMFERIKTRYPFSKYAVLAELGIGDAHFKKGEYLEAIDAYRNFIKLHPRHPKLDYVVYRIGLSQFKDAPRWPQRDQTSTRQMLATISRFEERYPESEYLDEVQEMRAEGRRRLARGVFGIGQFYYRRGRFNSRAVDREAALKAAIGRFEQVLDEYPDVTDVAADALYHIGLTQLLQGDPQAAVETVARLRARYPEAESDARVLEKRIARVLEREARRARRKARREGSAREEEANEKLENEEGVEPRGGASEPEREVPAADDDTMEAPPPPARDDGFMPMLEEPSTPVEAPAPPPPSSTHEDDFMPRLEPEPSEETGEEETRDGAGPEGAAQDATPGPEGEAPVKPGPAP